ncbi:G-type lectin S-receptor-like serine/threonine-protein kinase SD1-29 [Rosa rugosa]|uniref:G-type lectin S-receptor-like serine/threonine-protein kinase SD1-29 n=1 Tax=Rosa rugosa TaxID=74645 RepID=UPI002B40A196|nr:G-type lectin S-receptor-like serine/threonine-protein kinase SD1-29 [Rosa rugosa]
MEDGKQNFVWSTNGTIIQVSSSNASSVVASLSDSGNFVVKDVVVDRVVWESFDHPCDTMLPTQLLGYNTKSKKGTFLTAWKSESDPSTGIYTVEGGRVTEIPAQVIIWINRSTPFWRSGPWDKSKFIDIPAMDDQELSGFKGDENVEQGTQYFSYKLSTLAAYLERNL